MYIYTYVATSVRTPSLYNVLSKMHAMQVEGKPHALFY